MSSVNPISSSQSYRASVEEKKQLKKAHLNLQKEKQAKQLEIEQ